MMCMVLSVSCPEVVAWYSGCWWAYEHARGGRYGWAGFEVSSAGASAEMAVDTACLRCLFTFLFFFSSRRRHTRFDCDWSSDVCSSDLGVVDGEPEGLVVAAGAEAREGRDDALVVGVVAVARDDAEVLEAREDVLGHAAAGDRKSVV